MKQAHSQKYSKIKSQKVKRPETPAKYAKGVPKSGGKNSGKDLFESKIRLCSAIFDFSDESKDVPQKMERLKAITDLQNMLKDHKSMTTLIIPNLSLVMGMIEKNIFRPLPNVKKNTAIEVTDTGLEQQEEVDPAWRHIQEIYEFFLQLIMHDSLDQKDLKYYVTPQFIQEFLYLFNSEEIYERDYLKNILHKLYAKIIPRRKMMRKAMTDSFVSLIHEDYKFVGAGELLDIFASIISGFALPLRDEHVQFFKNVIIPLHKVQTNSLFFEQLLKCSMLFIQKDKSLSIYMLEGLLKYWPFANCMKETLFLTELQEVLECCEIEALEPVIPKLFKRIVKCISGYHLQISDRTMCFFENDHFLSILKAFGHIVFPMLVPVISELSETHWHSMIKESLIALKTILKDIDPYEFENALNMYPNHKKEYEIEQKTEKRKKLDQKWLKLHEELKNKYQNYSPPETPFTDTKMIANFNDLYKRIYDKDKFTF